jgi:hypothetical protein
MRDRPVKRASKFRWQQQTTSSRTPVLSRQAVLWVGLGAAAFLVMAGFWIHHASEEALRDKLRLGLETVLATDVVALEFWIGNELQVVRDWSELPQVREWAERLAAMAANNKNTASDLLAAGELAELRETMQSLVDSDDYDGFGLVGRDGLVLAARRDEVIGQHSSAPGTALLAQVLEGQALMTRPFQVSDLFPHFTALQYAPRMFAVAPVHDRKGGVIAALFLVIKPDKDFTRILSIARLGDSGDTYAFDRDGLMLSDSRHDDQLKAIGLIPDTPGARSILKLQIRDPGGDMTRGYTPDTPPAGRPLTRLVAAALDGQATRQVILTPYRDHRGVKVVGAYQWLSEYGFGIATEVSVQAAFAAMRPLRWMVFGLLGLLALGAALILASGFAIQFLRRRVEQVRQLGQYTLERKLGEGGMGEVYLARHALLRRPTAVKFIRSDRVSEDNLVHFEREVQLTSELTHPNTIEIYDFGRTEEGIFYYVMEYLPGLTLASLMELEHSIPPSRAVYILKQLCASLAEAHARGLIHRDVKPLNVILTERGGRFDFVKVLDFGLVKDVRGSDSGDETTAQEVAGTPPYIAPERLRDPTIMDTRSDLFCVGVIGFNLLTGKQPFDGGSTMEIVYQVVNSTAPRPREVSEQAIPPALEQLIVDCLAPDPEDRPASAERIIERLDAIGLTERWDQQAAKSWWTKNAKRVGTAGHEVAVSARRAIQHTASIASDTVSQ